MTSTLHLMYKELEKCTESLEEDVRRSLEEVNPANSFSENVIALESSKDYHFKEILSQLRQIKDHIEIIADHNRSIELLQNKISGSKIDKDYIKRQVETFQKIGVVNRREHKSIRPRDTSSLKLLECWEKMVEEQQGKEGGEIPSISKRPHNARKNRKIVSSTDESFLESPSGRSRSFESLLEESRESVEVVNEEVVPEVSEDINLERSNRGQESFCEVEEEDSRNDIIGQEKINDNIQMLSDHESSSEGDEEDTKPRIIDVIYKKNINGAASS